jgi:hypothetical protein
MWYRSDRLLAHCPQNTATLVPCCVTLVEPYDIHRKKVGGAIIQYVVSVGVGPCYILVITKMARGIPNSWLGQVCSIAARGCEAVSENHAISGVFPRHLTQLWWKPTLNLGFNSPHLRVYLLRFRYLVGPLWRLHFDELLNWTDILSLFNKHIAIEFLLKKHTT